MQAARARLRHVMGPWHGFESWAIPFNFPPAHAQPTFPTKLQSNMQPHAACRLATIFRSHVANLATDSPIMIIPRPRLSPELFLVFGILPFNLLLDTLLSPSTSVRGELKTNVACGTVGRCHAAFTAWGATVITPTMPPAGPFGAARPLVPLQRHPIVHRERFGTVPALAVPMSSRSGLCLWKRPAHPFVPLPRYVVVSSEYFATMTAVRHHLQMGACGTPA